MHIGDSRKFVGAIRDLTDRKTAEEALRRSEEHLRTVIENSSDVITIIDADGVIRSESPALERISGFSRDELKNRQVSTLSARLTAAISPILILFLAVVVGLILFATILPILEAGNGL